MRTEKRKIINNTKLIMNILSYLELIDLVKMRGINSTCKIISDYYIKMNINRDKIKYKSAKNYNSSDTNNTEDNTMNRINDYTTAITNNDNNNTSVIRMKFLQLWNIYSNKNNIDKIDYSDNKLVDIIKVIFYLMLNIKDNNDDNLIFNHFNFSPELYKIFDSVQCEFSNIGNINGDVENRDNYHKYNYIQEFFKNETVWKCIAILSGYNLSNAELVNNENGNIIDYYLWPEKISEPIQCVISGNIADFILFKLSNISNVSKSIQKQIHFLMNKNKSAELNFYNNNGVIVNKVNINVPNNDHIFSNVEFNKEFLDISYSDSSGKSSFPKNSSYSFSEYSSVNDEMCCNLIIWILNIIKVQKQLSFIKKTTFDPNRKCNSFSSPSQKRSLSSVPFEDKNQKCKPIKSANYIHSSYNSNNNPKSQNVYANSRCYCCNYKTENREDIIKCDNTSDLHVCERRIYQNCDHNSSSSYDEYKQLPETVSKLYNVVKTQESLLSDLKYILNTIKR
ncbi:hypothetical protein FG379_001254 [Cryptosporidium bovis]|uniref:uncharacterized protein n=1 Tax=Cryptosporidium bovis TaxID=310047 RepID=UPI00351A38AC|nr:hypothetical protein FG379_001254 [Cryptosporidium bovis]